MTKKTDIVVAPLEKNLPRGWKRKSCHFCHKARVTTPCVGVYERAVNVAPPARTVYRLTFLVCEACSGLLSWAGGRVRRLRRKMVKEEWKKRLATT